MCEAGVNHTAPGTTIFVPVQVYFSVYENMCAPGTERISKIDISVDIFVMRHVKQYCTSTP